MHWTYHDHVGVIKRPHHLGSCIAGSFCLERRAVVENFKMAQQERQQMMQRCSSSKLQPAAAADAAACAMPAPAPSNLLLAHPRQ